VGPKRFICAVAAVTGALATASPAMAAPNTYCVAKPECEGIDVVGFQSALNAAKMHLGRDRIELGATSFSSPNEYSYVAVGHNSVEIVGAGAGETSIRTTKPGSATTLTLSRGSVSDVEIKGPPSNAIGDFTVALDLTGHAERVKLTGGFVNLSLAKGASIDHSTLTGAGLDYDRPAVLVAEGKATLADSTVEGLTVGLLAKGTGILRVDRSTIAARNGVTAVNGGGIEIHDSLIRGTGAGGNGIAVYAKDDVAGVYATNVTVVGTGTPTSTGVLSNSIGPNVQANVVLWNSAVTRTATSLKREATAGAAYLAANNSAFDGSSTVSSGNGSFQPNGANIVVAPEFAGDDFHLPAGSPLIDAGEPVAGGVPVSELDLDGQPRSTDGNGDGVAAPDIGAFEAGTAAGDPPVDQPPVVDPTPPGAEVKPPVLSRVSLSNKRFRVRKAATAFRFKLSKDARVRISIARTTKVKGKVKRRAAGKLSRAGKKGKNRIAFTGRVGKRALKPGRYVAVVRATDAGGRVSKKRTVKFTIVRSQG
jgi:hypothetical protein